MDQQKVAAYIEQNELILNEMQAELNRVTAERDRLNASIEGYNAKTASTVQALIDSGRLSEGRREELTQKLASNPVNVLHLLTNISETTPTQVMSPIGRPTGAAKTASAKTAANSRRVEVDQEYLAGLNLPPSMAGDLRRG